MVYSRFRFVVVLRVILLGVTIFLLFYLYFNTEFYVTMMIVAAGTLYQIYGIIHYVEKTDRDLTRFLLSIRYEDFSESFIGKGSSSADRLRKAFAEVMNEFRRIRSQREEHYRYLQTVVQHVGIGLIAFKENGNVELINSAAKHIFNISHLHKIQNLNSRDPNLVKTLMNLKPGRKKIVKLTDQNDLLQLAIYATEFKMKDQKFKLVSIQNIHSELEEKELEAWQNIMRVLTHEIMNSITPIASLASTIHDLLEGSNGADAQSKENSEDINLAVRTIKKRSHGLLHFVDSFRNLSKIPKPKFQIIPVKELFGHLESFFQQAFSEHEIAYRFDVQPASLEVTADPELIEQVLINLILNAIHAVKERAQARIEVTAKLDERGRVSIQVADSGPGIGREALEKIFIPFYTTKPDGSGIGLSLARQIMRLHKGSITVQSIPNQKTLFSLKF